MKYRFENAQNKLFTTTKIFNSIHVHFSLSHQSCNEFHSNFSKIILDIKWIWSIIIALFNESVLRWCSWEFFLVRMLCYLCQLSMSRIIKKGRERNHFVYFVWVMTKMLVPNSRYSDNFNPWTSVPKNNLDCRDPGIVLGYH
jgi:hypothetical protein